MGSQRSGEPSADDELDAALTWEGDEERGLEAPAQRRVRTTATQGPATAGDIAEDDQGDRNDEPAGLGSASLVLLGVLAGLSIIWTLGWISVVGASTISFTDLLGEVMYQLGEFLAIASPVLWFGAVLLLARGASAATRIRWHALGLVLTAPWPLVIGAFG